MMRVIAGAVVLGVLVLGLAAAGYAPYHSQSPPQAGSVKTQATTAATHAGFAAEAATLASVQQHLGHTLNCIEGKQGKNFNAAWGHPCEGQGSGILVDLKGAAGGAALMPVVEAADALALQGVKSSDINQAKFAAKGVGALMKIVADNAR